MGQDHPLGLTEAEARELLVRLRPVASEIVLVGGQAVAAWVDRYFERSKALREGGPYATKDIDFVGTAEQAATVAALLGGSCHRYTPGDRTPCTAVVRLPGGVQIDFLRAPLGFSDPDALRRGSVPYEHGLLMHPLDVLRSRAANVAQLEAYQTERSIKQLRAAVICLREYAVERLDESPQPVEQKIRLTLKLTEEVFRLAGSSDGLTVFAKHGIDVSRAAPVRDPRLPQPFLERRLPQLLTQLANKQRDFILQNAQVTQASTPMATAEPPPALGRDPGRDGGRD